MGSKSGWRKEIVKPFTSGDAGREGGKKRGRRGGGTIGIVSTCKSVNLADVQLNECRFASCNSRKAKATKENRCSALSGIIIIAVILLRFKFLR
jgi:hypothetical protein